MKHRLPPIFATALLGIAGWTAFAMSCDDKAKSAQASNASMQACTAAQAAACKAKGASAMAASSSGANMCGAKATAAHAGCPFAKDANVTMSSSCSHDAAVTAGGSTCAHGMEAAAHSACSHGANAMAAAGHSGSCGGYGMAMAANAYAHSNCDACADMATCENQLRSANTVSQVVPLKNGIMYVFTADSPSHVRAVQAAMARRNDRLTALAAAGDKVHLCPECKLMRGAVASGKLAREVVNIEGGCLTLMTSSDPSIVSRLHNMASAQTAARTKM